MLSISREPSRFLFSSLVTEARMEALLVLTYIANEIKATINSTIKIVSVFKTIFNQFGIDIDVNINIRFYWQKCS